MRGIIHLNATAGIILGLALTLSLAVSTGICSAEAPKAASSSISTRSSSTAETSRHSTARQVTAPVDAMGIMQQRARNEYNREQGYHFDKIQRGNPHLKEIALTFDDGPHQVYTRKLLDVLNSMNVHATFFLVGKQVVKYPQLIQLEVMDGDEVGNHTYDHVNLTKISSKPSWV